MLRYKYPPNLQIPKLRHHPGWLLIVRVVSFGHHQRSKRVRSHIRCQFLAAEHQLQPNGLTELRVSFEELRKRSIVSSRVRALFTVSVDCVMALVASRTNSVF